MDTKNYQTVYWIISGFNSLYKNSLYLNRLTKRADPLNSDLSGLKRIFDADVKRKYDENNHGYMNVTDTFFFSGDATAQTILTRFGKKVWNLLQEVEEESIDEVYKKHQKEKHYLPLFLFFGFEITVDKVHLSFHFDPLDSDNILIDNGTKIIEVGYLDDLEKVAILNGKTLYQVLEGNPAITVQYPKQ